VPVSGSRAEGGRRPCTAGFGTGSIPRNFSVTASAGASITAGVASQDLFPTIIGAISPDAHANEDELKSAGLTGARIAPIEEVLKKAVSRKLELAIAAEFGSLDRNEAAFLYEIDLAALDGAAQRRSGSRPARRPQRTDGSAQGCHGSAQHFHASPNVRASRSRSICSAFSTSPRYRNWRSRAPSRGRPPRASSVIVDQATASRIQTGSVNFGADEEETAVTSWPRASSSPPHIAAARPPWRRPG